MSRRSPECTSLSYSMIPSRLRSPSAEPWREYDARSVSSNATRPARFSMAGEHAQSRLEATTGASPVEPSRLCFFDLDEFIRLPVSRETLLEVIACDTQS